MTEPASLVELRRVLQVAAPDAAAEEIDRRARAIAAYAAMIGAGGVASASRGPVPGLKALEGLYERVGAVWDELDQFQPDAQIALRQQPGAPSLSDMNLVLSAWSRHIAAAHAALSEASEDAAPTRRGRGRKDEAKRIARYCGAAFTALTGKKAAITNRDGQPAHGPFLDMVRGAFAALGIEASAEAAVTGKPMEKTRPPTAL